MIMLDTNICIHISHARPAAVLQRFSDYRMGDIGICSVVAAEWAYGVAKSGSERNRQALDLFLAPEIHETSLHMSTETRQREEPAEQKTTTTRANHKNSLQQSPKPEDQSTEEALQRSHSAVVRARPAPRLKKPWHNQWTVKEAP